MPFGMEITLRRYGATSPYYRDVHVLVESRRHDEHLFTLIIDGEEVFTVTEEEFDRFVELLQRARQEL